MAKPQDPLWNYELWCATKLSWLSIIEFTTTTQIHVYWFSYDGVCSIKLQSPGISLGYRVLFQGRGIALIIQYGWKDVSWIESCLPIQLLLPISFIRKWEELQSNLLSQVNTFMAKCIAGARTLLKFFLFLINFIFKPAKHVFFFSNYRAGNRLSQTQGTYSAWCNSLR